MELWEQPKPAHQNLTRLERLLSWGRRPPQPSDSKPRIMASATLRRRETTPRAPMLLAVIAVLLCLSPLLFACSSEEPEGQSGEEDASGDTPGAPANNQAAPRTRRARAFRRCRSTRTAGRPRPRRSHNLDPGRREHEGPLGDAATGRRAGVARGGPRTRRPDGVPDLRFRGGP